MTSFSYRDLSGNEDLERAEMDAAFGYGLPLTEAEMDAHAAEHDADVRRNDEAAFLAEWPTVLRLNDDALISIVGQAPADIDGMDEFTAACAIELTARMDGVRASIPRPA